MSARTHCGVLALSIAQMLCGWQRITHADLPSLAENVVAPPENVAADWALQDDLIVEGQIQIDAIHAVIDGLAESVTDLQAERETLRQAQTPAEDPKWLALYHRACHSRRATRLAPYLDQIRRVVFTKHYNLGGSHYAYTEGQSDAQNERHFQPGSALCILEMDGVYGQVNTLLADSTGVLRDPAVSWDGQRILFAWKKSDRLDDYHLYELEVASKKVRQLTFGLGVADYEPAYLPNGDIMFASTRCVQTVDCWWTEVSNLYTCGPDGQYLRRISVDQVHSNFPTVTDDGRVIYTRWDYSDRGQIFPQGLFQMNPDGTRQTELYGNNSWFPTTIAHARAIPGTQKVVAIFTGHHTHQRGQLGILDPGKGRQESSGAQLIAPVRETPAVKIDAYGQEGTQFQYPYPLSATAFLTTMDPIGAGNRNYATPYAIYLVDIEGHRELLVSDPQISCNQPIPLRATPKPPTRPSAVDYTRDTGTYYVQDIYAGPGLSGVPRGTIKKLRVVELGFRAAGVGSNRSHGPAGGALASTPVSVGNGCWDSKTILGEATVYADGSACFEVPSLTPVYFQALDGKGRTVQTMRSWSTLQPGEKLSCVGCHESKNETPISSNQQPLAVAHGPQTLVPPYGQSGGFSFAKRVQPILDKHCVECHCDRSSVPGRLFAAKPNKAFSLLGKDVLDRTAKRRWSDAYLMLTDAVPETNGNCYAGNPEGKWVEWISVQSAPHMLPPYYAGSATSPLMALLEKGHQDTQLSAQELGIIAAWIDLLIPFCGDYTEAHAWSESEQTTYASFQRKRKRLQDLETQNVMDFLTARAGSVTLTASAPEQPPASDVYHNVALSLPGQAVSPHATSNSEFQDLPWFTASCAINGHADNQGHGRRFPSWGPEQRADVWWRIDFGGAVEIDKLVLFLRADFPHDKQWQRATVEFSDGSQHPLRFRKTAEPQVFTFEPRTVTWLQLSNFVQREPLGWCALTEAQVWGRRPASATETDLGRKPRNGSTQR